MELGAFSVSLTVKNLAVSKAFYEKLGFEVTGGDQAQNWLVMRNGDHAIGLFQGMFDANILTFNPGWGPRRAELGSFTDVRDIAKSLKESGIEFRGNHEETDSGPAHIQLTDPDGNSILIDQHV